MALDVLSTPGHLVSLAARGFARLSEARLKPLGFGVGHLPVLVALQDGRASTQRDFARFARIEQPPMAQMQDRAEDRLEACRDADRPNSTCSTVEGPGYHRRPRSGQDNHRQFNPWHRCRQGREFTNLRALKATVSDPDVFR